MNLNHPLTVVTPTLDATAWTGNDARVLELTEVEVAAMSTEHVVLASISQDALPFWGRHDLFPVGTDLWLERGSVTRECSRGAGAA